MSLLVIYKGNEDICLLAEYSYTLDVGKVNDTKDLSSTKKLNNRAIKYRDEYSDYIYTINDLYLNNNLIYDNKLSLYFISDLSNKRTEMFDTYVTICHICLLKDCIIENNITKVKFINCDKNFIKSFKSNINIAVEEIDSAPTKITKNYFIYQTYFFVKCFFYLFYIKLSYNNNNANKIDNLFLSRYPFHFDKNFKEEKYGSLVNDNDYFLVSILTDGIHQNLSFLKFIDAVRKLSNISKTNNVILLDREVSLIDLIKNYFYSLWLFFSFKKINKQKYLFKNIDISSYIADELHQSMLRIPRLTLYKNAIQKILTKTKVSKFYYYLHEYIYGRFFTFVLKHYFPNIKRIGFQHGPASMKKLLYFLSKNEVNYNSTNAKKYLPMPDIILAEDQHSLNVYQSANYQNIHIMEQIYRFSYLKNITRNNVEKNSILIACGLHDSEYLFNILQDKIKKNKDKKYFFKLHPKISSKQMRLNINKSGLNNIELSEGHINKYLSFVNEVIVTYSSVGLEAHKLGIKVTTLTIPGKIDESPLTDD